MHSFPMSAFPTRRPAGSRHFRLRPLAVLLVAAGLGMAAAMAAPPAMAQTGFDLSARITSPGAQTPAPVQESRPHLARGQAWIPGQWMWQPHPGRGRKHRRHASRGQWVWIPGYVAAVSPGWNPPPSRWNRGGPDHRQDHRHDRRDGAWIRVR